MRSVGHSSIFFTDISFFSASRITAANIADHVRWYVSTGLSNQLDYQKKRAGLEHVSSTLFNRTDSHLQNES